jgi:hypothetical protein
MICAVCGQRKSRRACPALQREICPVCCGRQRLVEIACPSDCAYLAEAQRHPAAPVRRQHEADLRLLLATTGGLTEWQFQLFFLVQAALSRFRPEGGRLVDTDVADAAAALAATFETAANGVLYDHSPDGTVARRLAAELRVVLDDIVARAGRRVEADVARVLRAVERGAASASGGGPTAYMDLVARVLREGQPGPPTPDSPSGDRPRIILT